MDDEKPSFADEPNFLASLGDLERGLGATHESIPEKIIPSPAPPRRPAPPASPEPAPRGTVFPEAFLESNAAAESGARPVFEPPPIEGGRRPLLDLFPAVSAEPLRPPAPMRGTSPGPRLSPSQFSTAVARARPAPPPVEAAPYEAFYGLNEPPFSLTADPKFFYHSTSHDHVAQELLTAIRRRDGGALVIGEAGMGKTTICRAVIDQLDRRTIVSFVAEPFDSTEELLKTVLVDFGVISRDDARAPATRERLTSALASFLASLAPLQASAVVVIDDAQGLAADVLADLPGMAGSGALQMVLVGQPRLERVLRQPRLKELAHQLAVRCRVEPLAADEILEYVRHRLAVAGTSPRVDFDDAAVSRLHELTGGVPRLVNLLCDRALAHGCESAASVITGAMVAEAAGTLEFETPADRTVGVVRTLLVVLALVMLTLLGAGGALWVFRDSVARAIAQWERVPAAPAPPAPRQLEPLAPPAPGNLKSEI